MIRMEKLRICQKLINKKIQTVDRFLKKAIVIQIMFINQSLILEPKLIKK